MSGGTYWKSTSTALLLSICIHSASAGVVVVKSSNSAAHNQAVEGFRQGYQGSSTVVESKRELQRALGEQPSYIVAIGTEAMNMAQEQARNVPLFYMAVRNARASGSNVAGIAQDLPGGAQLALFQRLLPQLRSVAVIYNPSASSEVIQQAEFYAKSQGIRLLAVPANSVDEAKTACALVNDFVDALWVVMDTVLSNTGLWRDLAREARDRNLPLFSSLAVEALIQYGVLAGPEVNYRETGKHCAELLREVEQGQKKLADIGVQAPSVNLLINGGVARTLGIRVPESLQSIVHVY